MCSWKQHNVISTFLVLLLTDHNFRPMKYLLLISIFIAIVFSCTPPVVFDTAYPTETSDLLEIPFEYQGAFICDSDSSLIIINKTNIIIPGGPVN